MVCSRARNSFLAVAFQEDDCVSGTVLGIRSHSVGPLCAGDCADAGCCNVVSFLLDVRVLYVVMHMLLL